MRIKILFGLLLVVVFVSGVATGVRFFHFERRIELHLKFEPKSGFVTVYTFYRDRSGNEVKHGESYEFDVGGSINVHERYQDGKIVGGRMKFN